MDIEKLKEELDECGFVIIHNLISTAEANRMAKRLMEIMGQQADADQCCSEPARRTQSRRPGHIRASRYESGLP